MSLSSNAIVKESASLNQWPQHSQGLDALKSGLGLRPELFSHIEAINADANSPFGFLEAHSENYFGESIARTKLLQLREQYPITLHGVGLSLGRADDLNQQHLTELKQLVDEVQPAIVSEHLAWSAYSHQHLPDLLPLPLTEQALDIICQHIDQMQTALGRQILLENPSNYLLFDRLQIPEPEFLNTLAQRTGCGLLVDVNNIHVSSTNIGRDPIDYINALNSDFIGQYHLAGYTEVQSKRGEHTEIVLIDTHNHTVYEPVWGLFDHVLATHGARPTLFEWDSDFPEFDVLIDECIKANSALEKSASVNSSSVSCASSNVGSGSLSKLGLSESAHLIADSEVSLEDWQSEFLHDVLALKGLSDLASQDYQHRISIYQNNVFAAIQDYLEEVYPATKGVVGADFFKQMAQLFIQNSPPSEGNIHNYGDAFEALCSSLSGLENLPYLADLIRYEWALHKSYFSVVSDALDPASLPQDELLTSTVSFNDSVFIIESQYPIYEIHRQSLPDFDGEVSIDLAQSQDILLVYKLGHVVSCLQLEQEQASFIQEIEKSENLLQAIEALQGSILADSLSTALSLVFEVRLLSLSE